MKRAMKMAAAVTLAATSVMSSAAYAEKPAELSATELAKVQSKAYPVPAKVAFGAAIATLQSLGYMDIIASKDAGTISAQTEAKGKIIYNILWGFGKKKLTQKASLLVEENGADSALVRLNLLLAETKARGIFGTSFSDGKLVKVAEPYGTFFTAMDAEVARRTVVPAAAAPAPAAPANSATVPPVAATAN